MLLAYDAKHRSTPETLFIFLSQIDIYYLRLNRISILFFR